MDLNTFLDHFDTIAEAPSGIAKLKALILDLAVRGKLVSQNSEDDSASVFLEKIQFLKNQSINYKKRKTLAVDSDEVPFDAPEGWAWVYFEEIVESMANGIYKSDSYYCEDGIACLRMYNIDQGKINFQKLKRMNLSDVEIQQYELKPGDLLVNRVNSRELVGKAAVIPVINEPLIFESKNIRVRFFEPNYLPSYICNLFQTGLIRKIFEGNAKQTTGQASVNQTQVASLLIPLPPLAEQKRIVEKVDELMALCDRLAAAKQTRDDLRQKLRGSAIAALMNAETDEVLEKSWAIVRDNWHTLSQDPKDVDELRRSILQLAVRGKLIDQDPTDQSALLLASQIKEGKTQLAKPKQVSKPVHNPFEIAFNWVWLKIGDFYDVSGGIQKTPKRAPVSNYLPYLRVANVQRGYLDLEEIEYFELLDSEMERWNLQSGDLLIVEGNGSSKEIGRCAIWNGEIEKCVHQNHIIRARPVGHSSQLFTLMFLNSPSGMAEMRSLAITTSGLYSLSVGKIREIVIPLPPLAEQKRIVAKVDELMQMCDQLEASLRQSQQRASALAASAISHLTI